jgi:Fe-S cluster assembly protein SufD
MTEILDISHINRQFALYQAQLNGHANSTAHQVRSQAHALLQTMELPTTATEDWRYTNLRALYNQAFEQQTPAQKITTNDLLPIKNLDAYNIVLLNGILQPEHSQLPSLNGITITPLHEAQKNQDFNAHFGTSDHRNNIFSVMNTAAAQQGIFIHIATGTILPKPLYITHLCSTDHHLRHLIVAEPNSQATIIENFGQYQTNIGFTNAFTEIILQKNAHITHYKLQTELKNSYHIGTTEATQQADSTFTSFNFGWSGGIVRNNINALQANKNCNTNYYGVYAPTGTQHIDNQTFIHHFSPHCQSNEIYKGLINDSAKAVFNGKILVAQDAQKINAYQSNKNILLSDNATVNAKPQLEIFADDVKCSHGATVGQLDPSQMFYLRARGIDKATAQTLLTNAFAAEVFELCTLPAIKEHLYQSFIDRS